MSISTTYTLTNTKGDLNFTIKAGGALGPHEATQNTDLTFYGYSRTGWGQEVDQNFYKLLENFACSQLTAYPAAAPKTKTQLGSKFGINVPIIGQSWFNTTSNELYIYSPGSSDIYYNGTTTNSNWQHIISETFADDKYMLKNEFTGATTPLYRNGSNSPMTGFLSLHHAPTDANHAATKLYVDGLISSSIITAINNEDASIKSFVNGAYVHKVGDIITGGLAVTGSATGLNTLLAPFILATITGGNARFEMGNVAPFDITSGGVTTHYITSSPYIDFHSSGNNIDCDSRIIASGGTNVSGQGTLQLLGYIVSDGRTPTLGIQLVHKSWVDQRINEAVNSSNNTSSSLYLRKAGDAMAGQLNMNGNRIVNIPNPVNNQDPVPLKWLTDRTYAPKSVGGLYGITISGANPSGGNNGDIWFVV